MSKKKTKKAISKPTNPVVPTSTIARSDDGTVQITFTIPYSLVDKTRQKVVEKLAESIEVPGFRKGNAPLAKAVEHIPQETVIQQTLSSMLPQMVGDVIKKENLKPAIYPKFELIKANPDEPWEVRATTCELPKVTLGDYKKEVKGAGKAKAIWTPSSAKAMEGKPDKEEKELTLPEKEQEIIKILLKTSEVKIPKILIDEEVNTKLSQLLERIEKLGLNLDSYLASIGKNAQTIRAEYEAQARNSISLELILTEIVNKEATSVEKSEVDQAVKAGSTTPDLTKKLDTPEQRRIIESVLKRRKVLETLVALF